MKKEVSATNGTQSGTQNSHEQVVAIIIAVLVALWLGFSIYMTIAYGGKPITEMPAWAAMFFMRGGR